MSEKFSELPNKINNTSAKELSDEAETRKLNDETTGNAYPLPNITEILDPLGSANCLSTFDLAKIQKQDSTNFVNVSTIIGKEIASVSHSKTSIKLHNIRSAVNKVKEEEKRVTKEKDSKHFQAEETQVQRAQRNQKGKNRESPVEDIYKNLNKYPSHWIIIGLKILYWLLHLILDVGNIVGSADLMIPPGKYRWYHTILYTKYFLVNMAAALSKICILNAISKQLDNWIDISKPASWRKIKTKMKERNETLPAQIGFGHLAREPIGEVTIEENMDPTYAEYLEDLFDKLTLYNE
ncbi:uncharacterized protein LOC117152291 [Bombus impatiens]|uniref:Uncharacterized protein LOC117152291 n=1 Tax=Bombus impatiens TaxID=132113 RepID=A0A6P8L5M0_BOMIM|nr:uncharacterized protein LOC117152291 [Bombus impatiens]